VSRKSLSSTGLVPPTPRSRSHRLPEGCRRIAVKLAVTAIQSLACFSSLPCTLARNSRMLWPSPRPISGSLPAPKTNTTMPRMISNFCDGLVDRRLPPSHQRDAFAPASGPPPLPGPAARDGESGCWIRSGRQERAVAVRAPGSPSPGLSRPGGSGYLVAGGPGRNQTPPTVRASADAESKPMNSRADPG